MTRIPQESIWGAENTKQALNNIPTFVMKATTLLKKQLVQLRGFIPFE